CVYVWRRAEWRRAAVQRLSMVCVTLLSCCYSLFKLADPNVCCSPKQSTLPHPMSTDCTISSSPSSPTTPPSIPALTPSHPTSSRSLPPSGISANLPNKILPLLESRSPKNPISFTRRLHPSARRGGRPASETRLSRSRQRFRRVKCQSCGGAY